MKRGLSVLFGGDALESEQSRPRRVLGRIGPVLAGVAVVIVLSVGTDASLQAVGIFPRLGEPMPGRLLLVATMYRTAYVVVGGNIAARLAPDRPMRYAMALGIVGLVLSTAGAVSTWGVGPAWYPLSLVATAMPGA